jgi:hypothetical protein
MGYRAMSGETAQQGVKAKAAAAAADTAAETAGGRGEICMIDLGAQERARIRRLRRGEGRLMRQVLEVTDSLKGEGVLGSNAQLVVVLVRERASATGLFDALIEDRDDDDDDDDDD